MGDDREVDVPADVEVDGLHAPILTGSVASRSEIRGGSDGRNGWPVARSWL
jgi:hypothetical protein